MLALSPGWAQGLVLRHPWPDAQAPLARLAAEYARQSGVAVTVAYSEGATPAAAGADIVGLHRYSVSQPAVAALARAGRVQDLSPWMDPSWRSALNPAMIAPFLLRRDNRWGAPPGLYGVPVSGYLQLFLYRPDLFARARVAGDPQRWRWEDFLAAGRRLRAASVEPLVGAFHHRGHPALSQMYEQAHLGLSGLFATYRGEVPYRSPRWLGLFSQYVDLRQAGMGTSALALAPRPEAEAAFIAGKAAMLVDGPWFAGVQEQQAPRFAGWRVFFPPWGGHGATFLPAAPGGVADSLTINPRSPRRAQAARFLRWLTTRTEVQTTYANATWMLPASFAATQSPRLHPRLKPFAARLTDAATDLTIFESPSVNRVLYAGVLAVLRGEATPQAVLADADRAKRRGR